MVITRSSWLSFDLIITWLSDVVGVSYAETCLVVMGSFGVDLFGNYLELLFIFNCLDRSNYAGTAV